VDKAAEGLIPAMPAADFLQHQKPSRHIRFRPRRLDSKFYDRSNPYHLLVKIRAGVCLEAACRAQPSVQKTHTRESNRHRAMKQ